MTIVNLYGTEEEIQELRDAANGVTLSEGFDIINPCDDFVRMNTNVDEPTTIARLEDARATVTHEEYKRDSNFVTELTARM